MTMSDDQLDKFNHVTHAECLDLLFPPAFSEERISTLAHEILHLMDTLRDTLKRQFSQLHFIISHAQERAKPTNISTADLFNEIKGNGMLGDHYMSAFICAELKSSAYDTELFLQYKSLTLAVSIKLLLMGRHHSSVKRVCDEMRLYSQGKRERLAAWLPDILMSTFPDLIAELDKGRTKAQEEANLAQLYKQLSRFYVPYNHSYKSKKGITRNTSSRTFTKQGALSVINRDDVEDGFSISILREFASTNTQSWEQEEINTSAEKQLCVIDVEPSEKSYHTQACQAKAISARMLKQTQFFSSDIYLASDFDITVLVKACLVVIVNNDDENKFTAQLLLLMLLFGSSAEQVRELLLFSEQGTVYVKRHFILPTFKQRPELRPFLNEVRDAISFPLPAIFSDLTNTTLSGIDDADINIFLKQINRFHHVNITLKKISNFMPQVFMKFSIDPVFTAIIQNTEVNDLAALSYTQIDAAVLMTQFDRYLKYIRHICLGIDKNKRDKDDTELLEALKISSITYSDHRFYLGSPLALTDKLLGFVFSELATRISSMKSVYSAQYHNFVTQYTQLILAQSSGYRPVTGFLGKLHNINLLTGEYWILDKQSRRSDATRSIFLPPLAREVLARYLEYVNACVVYFEQSNRQLSIRFNNILSSKSHLLFYLDGNNIVEVMPITIEDMIVDIVPFQINWHRHLTRTLLHRHDVHPDVIAAWMGHAEITQNTFSQFSSLEKNDLKQVTDIIEAHLLSLNIRAINYCAGLHEQIINSDFNLNLVKEQSKANANDIGTEQRCKNRHAEIKKITLIARELFIKHFPKPESALNKEGFEEKWRSIKNALASSFGKIRDYRRAFNCIVHDINILAKTCGWKFSISAYIYIQKSDKQLRNQQWMQQSWAIQDAYHAYFDMLFNDDDTISASRCYQALMLSFMVHSGHCNSALVHAFSDLLTYDIALKKMHCNLFIELEITALNINTNVMEGDKQKNVTHCYLSPITLCLIHIWQKTDKCDWKHPHNSNQINFMHC